MIKELDRFQKIAAQLIEAEKTAPVVEYIPIEDIPQEVDIVLNDDGVDEATWEKALTTLVMKTPRTQTKAFFNQLFGGRNPKAYLGELLAVMLNNSMYTYKVGGPMVAMEKHLLRKVADLVGYPETAEGTFAPGGSMTNLMGLLMARDRFDSDIRYKGGRQDMVMYTSKECHYSIAKNAAFAGIGRNNIREIATNDRGQMLSSALEEQIKKDIAEGLHPFFVNATAGTTVLGVFDPLQEIGEIAKKYNMWFHIDGAYFGSIIFSDKLRHLVAGCELSDSFTLNPHKLLGVPLQCSIIVTKHKQHLYDTFSNEASYLYQTSEDEYNPGKISMLCGRRNDALKLWALWKSVGTKGLGAFVENIFHLADVGRKYCESNPDYQLYSYDNTASICFNYKGLDPIELCTRLYEESEIMVGYGKFAGDTFVRLVTVNGTNTEEDIMNFFHKMETFVAKELLTPAL